MTSNIIPFKTKNGNPNVLYVMIHMVMDAIQYYAYVKHDKLTCTVLMDSARSAIDEESLWCEVPAHIAREIEGINYADLDAQLIDEAEESRNRD